MEPPSALNKLFKLFLIVNFVVLDVVVGYFAYKQVNTAPAPAPTVQLITEQPVNLPTPTPTPAPTPVPTPTPTIVYKTSPPKAKVRSVYYVSVPGNGSTLANDWVDLAGTDLYFDKADYPGLIEIYFEINSHLMNGNGAAYVRLFDVTHGIGVQGSEVQNSSQASSLVVSGQITFWAGKNLIRVQAKSLTADTAIFDSGRLRIVTEN